RAPALPGRRHARAATHEYLRRARPLHPRLRARRRAHAVRPVPRLHGRRAHAVRGEQSAPLRDTALRSRAAGSLACHAAAAEERDRLPRGALPRHRQGARRRSFRARRRRGRGFLSRAGPVAVRRAPGRLAGAQSPQLSITSQKQDIGDPQVINAFARKVGDETHLDYLYVLTCADVRATNPKLWNSWKASLFRDFYQRVKRALRRGLESPIDPEHLVRET